MPDPATLAALESYLDRLRLPAERPEHTVSRARELAEHMERAGFEFRKAAGTERR